jgi:SAM-dependent methyltransferase
MSNERIIDEVARYYSGTVEQHGPSPAGVDWNGEESQLGRFEQLAHVLPRHEQFSINDYGCGYGALVPYLDASGRTFDYVGFDVAAPMLDLARERFGADARIRFVGDERDLEPADYTVASGVFNVRLDTPEADWHAYCLGVVQRMAALSRHGLAFNMLTSYSDAPKMKDELHYADPLWWFDWCKRNLSRQVALLHDYGLWEFTMIVRLESEARS